MDQFLGKLINLSYEFFGIFLPGFFMIIFLFLWWWALGPLAPILTADFLAPINWNRIIDVADKINTKNITAEILFVVLASYFLGHFLHLISHLNSGILLKIEKIVEVGEQGVEGSKLQEGGGASGHKRTTWQVVSCALLFSDPKLRSYSPQLKRLFDSLSLKFTDRETPLDWREFYPVAKSYLAQNLTYSLVTTYQNKYTLYRSIVMAGVIIFWFSLASLIGVFVVNILCVGTTHWAPLLVLTIGAFSVVFGFSKSYLSNWEYFGNTIITEAFSAIYGPKHESRK